MTKPAPAQYRTTNWKDYNAALKARGSLSVWLDRDMQWHGQPDRERVMARDFDRQVTELQVRAAIPNQCTRLGTQHTIRVS